MKLIFAATSLLITISTVTFAQNFTLAGGAVVTSVNTDTNAYRLTESLNSSTGALWSNTMMDLNTNSFVVDYDLVLGQTDAGADGIAFVLQTSTPTTNLIGNDGEAMGFGIGTNCYNDAASANCNTYMPMSLAIEFDTYQNQNDPSFDHIAVVQNGDTRGTKGFPVLVPAIQMDVVKADVEDGLRYKIVISWDHAAKILTVDFNGARRVTYANDVVNTIFGGNSMVYWGFTASTGGQRNLHEIFNLNETFYGVLPVHMSSCGIKKTENNSALLNWSTASEINNNYFTVERSVNGKNFEEVTKVNAAGNTTSNRTYNAIDAKPLSGLSYYRIKQTDFDGKSSYSNVLPFENNKMVINANTNVTVYPVPASSEINIDFASETESLATTVIYDMFGKQMIVANQNLVSGANTIKIDLLQLTAGTYFVKVVSANGLIINAKQFNKLN